MKKALISFLFVFVVFTFFPCFAQNSLAIPGEELFPEIFNPDSPEYNPNYVKEGSLTFFLNQEQSTASVYYCDRTAAGKIVIPATFRGYKVSSIGWGAFQNCSDITSLTIPQSVTEIGCLAFDNCPKLKELTLYNINSPLYTAVESDEYDPDHQFQRLQKTPIEKITLLGNQSAIPDDAFSGMRFLKEVVLNGNIKTIGEFAFSGTKLKTITLPEALSSIGYRAFYNSKIESIVIPKNTILGDEVFSSCANLKTVTFKGKSIPNYTFSECTSLSSVTLSSNLKTIKTYAFKNCAALEKISLPSSLTEIDCNAFENCASLQTINFANGLKTIGDSAFSGCTALKKVSLPDSLTKIGSFAFSNCPNITYVKIPFVGQKRAKTASFGDVFDLTKAGSLTVEFSGACTYIPQHSFSNNTSLKKIILGKNLKTIYSNAFVGCTKLKSIEFSGKLETISTSAFSECKALKTVSLPSYLKSLGASAFRDCTSLKSITIGKNLKTIGSSAFENCKKLENIKIPSSVTEIKANAFQNCKALTKITLSNGLKKIGYEAFRGCSSLTSLYIPDSVTKISSYILSEADSIKTLRIPFFGGSKAKPSKLGFYNVPTKALKKLIIGDKCETVPEEAADGYHNLTTLTIGKNVKTIGVGAFSDCKKLKNITVGNKIERIGQTAFLNTAYVSNKANWSGKLLYLGKYLIKAKENITSANIKKGTRIIAGGAFGLCEKLKSIKLPSSLITIESASFWSCSSLKSITIPNKVTCIGSQAFAFCTSLEKASFGKSLKTIEDNAFWCCDKLKSVSLPDSVNKIGSEAFYACSSLKNLSLPRFAEIGKEAFGYTGNLKCVALSSTNTFYRNSFIGKHINFDGTKSELKKSVKSGGASKFISKNSIKYTSPRVVSKATLKKSGTITLKCAKCGTSLGKRSMATVKTIKLKKSTFSYSKKAIKPEVIVKDSNGNTLTQGKDYTVKYYGKRIKKGSYKVLVKLRGKYKGSKYLTFKIK